MPKLASVTRMVKETAQPRRRIDVRYLDDNVFFDAEGAFTAISVPCQTWDMLSPRDKMRALTNTYTTFNGLPRGHVHYMRLITARFPFNADLWASRLDKWVADRGLVPTAAWPIYLTDTRDKLNARRWPVKRVYLLVRLGDRVNYEGRWAQMTRRFRSVGDWVGLGDEMPAEAEVQYWREQAEDVRSSILRSPLRGQPVGGREMEMLLLHLTHPDLPVPDPFVTAPTRYGPGELRTLLGGEVTRVHMGAINQYQYECLRHTTATGTSYQIWFALSQAPDEVTFPNILWLDSPTNLPFPVVQSVGFEIQELSATRKDADKVNRAIDEQFYNDAEAGIATDLSVHEKKSRATAMKYAADQRVPFLRLRALWGISAQSPEDLTKRAREFMRHMREDAGGFSVDAPPRGQRRFFYESLPTGQASDSDYLRRVGLDYLAAGMPNISPAVGEGQGPYQGYTVDSQGNPAEPVFIDSLLYANDVEKAPTEAVPGDPGGGKTVSRGFKPVHEDALRGVTQAVKDGKGDFLVFAEEADNLGLDPNRITVVNVVNGDPGMLDPAGMAAKEDEVAPLMRQTLNRLVPDLLENVNGPGYRDCISHAVKAALAEPNNEGRYLGRIPEIMEYWANDIPEQDTPVLGEMRRFYAQLATRFTDYASHPHGRLLFGRSAQTYRVPEGQLVIFCTLGLKTPSEGVNRSELPEDELLGDVISGLMMDYMMNLMVNLPDHVHKSITWDEFHLDKDNARVPVLVSRIKRVGRAKNIVLRLISQSAGDFPASFMTAVYAFGSADREEAMKSCDLLRVERSNENIETIQQLADVNSPKGMCVIRDRDGNLGRVQIEFIYDWLLEIFRTNPEKKRNRVTKYLGEEAADILEQLETVRQRQPGPQTSTATNTAVEPPAIDTAETLGAEEEVTSHAPEVIGVT